MLLKIIAKNKELGDIIDECYKNLNKALMSWIWENNSKECIGAFQSNLVCLIDFSCMAHVIGTISYRVYFPLMIGSLTSFLIKLNLRSLIWFMFPHLLQFSSHWLVRQVYLITHVSPFFKLLDELGTSLGLIGYGSPLIGTLTTWLEGLTRVFTQLRYYYFETLRFLRCLEKKYMLWFFYWFYWIFGW